LARSPTTPSKTKPKDKDKDSGGQAPDGTMDAAQEALFREVEEDLRAEQFRRLWQRFGGYVIGAAVAVVAVVAGFEGWTAWQASVRADEADRYFSATTVGDQGDPMAAVDQLRSLAEDGQTGYAALAGLRRAEILATEGDTSAAIDAYDALSADGGAPQEVRDLAAMLAALLALDVEDAVSVRGRLRPLTGFGNPWRPMAEEMLALLSVSGGDTTAARAIYQGLVDDPNVPPGVRQRAAEMLAALGEPEAATDADAPGAAGGGADGG